MRIKISNERGSIALDTDKPPYVLTKVEGLGSAEAQLHTMATPFTDGVTWLASTAQPRTLSLSGAIIGDDEQRARLRTTLTAVLGVRAGMSTVTINAYGRERQIQGVVERAPVIVEKEGAGIEYQTFTATVYCPQPYFEDIQRRVRKMVLQSGGTRFPLALGTQFAMRHSTDYFNCINTGDVPCAIEATFDAGGTQITAPQLTNEDTGEFIRIRRVIPKGTQLIITTGFGEKTAYLLDLRTGEYSDAMGYLDLRSTFFQLAPGENRLNFNADVGRAEICVFVKWRARYAGF